MLGLFRRRSRADDAALLEEATGGAPLPTFPAAVSSALGALHGEDPDLGEVAERIERDPGVTVRLLRLVNSSAYGLKHPVANVRHAISILGLAQVEPVLVSCAVGRVLPDRPIADWSPRRFWRAAARRATVAAALAERVDPSARSDCFTAALLQDVAVPLLVDRHRDEYAPLLRRCYESGERLHELESEAFGWDHARIGRLFANEWHLPEPLVRAVGDHHVDGECDLRAAHVALSRLVAGLHEADDALGVEELIERAHDDLGIARDETRAVIERTADEIDEIAEAFA